VCKEHETSRLPPKVAKTSLLVFVPLYLLHNGPVTSSGEQAELLGGRRSESESAPIPAEIFSEGVQFAGGDPKPSDLPMGKLKFAETGHGGLNPRL